MSLCPICNQLREMHFHCSSCKQEMQDRGRVMDLFDDYSAYLPIDMMKMVDGIPNDLSEEKCPHLFYCEPCNNQKVMLIREEK
ncbi:hypothetical protein LC040_00665 [Bacillus tianshenii]|nr:hypothetical protein LC040_00665 [Bacillus tianshenii]